MKKLFTFLLIVMYIPSFSQSLADLENKKGYQNIVLGESIETIKDRKWPIRKDPEESKSTALYKYTGQDARRVGNVKLKRVSVKTFKDEIMLIILHLRPEDHSDMLTTLTAAYGSPVNGKWNTESVGLELSDNRAIFTYKPLYTKYQKEREETAKSAASSL